MNKKEELPRFRKYEQIVDTMRSLTPQEAAVEVEKWHKQQLCDPKVQIEILQKAIDWLQQDSTVAPEHQKIPYVCGLLEGMICALQYSLLQE